MGHDHERLDRPRAIKDVEFGNVIATYFELPDPEGAKRAGVLLRRFDKDADGREVILPFRADLDRLEAVVNHGNCVNAGLRRDTGNAPNALGIRAAERQLDLGSLTARYDVQEDHAGRSQVVVCLDQTFPSPGREDFNQYISCDLGRLKGVVQHGILFERERGHERKYYAVVEIEGLREEGWVRARVVRWDEKEAAQRYAGENRNSGYGLYDWPFRHKLLTTLTIKESEIPSLGAEIRYLKAQLSRVGPGLVLGTWYEKGQEPREGMFAKILGGIALGGRDPTSREPTDYRIVPAGVQKPQGPGENPISIIVDIDRDHNPPVHRIIEIDRDPGRALEKFQELKIERLKHEQDIDISQAMMPRGGFRR